MKTSPELLGLIRAKIAMDQLLKKVLAKECGVSRAYFSQQLHGDVPMREDVLETLLERLELKNAVQRIGLL